MIGTALSALVFQIKQEAVSERQRAIFSENANDYFQRFQWELDVHVDTLHALRNFMLAGSEINPDDFGAIAKGSQARAFALRFLQWIPAVSEEEREAFEAGRRTKGNGFEDFSIFSVDSEGNRVRRGSSDWFYPVLYMEPAEKYRSWVGLDLGARDDQRERLKRARESGSLTVLSDWQWDKDLDGSKLLLLLPIFSESLTPIAGFVTGSLDIDSIFKRISFGRSEGIFAEISDRGEDRTVLFSSKAALEKHHEVSRVTSSVTLGNEYWDLTIFAKNQALTPGGEFEAWSVLGMGLILTGILALWVGQRQAYLVSVESEVSERTEALSQVNLNLQKEMEHRRQAESELLQSEARFREAFLHAPIGIALLSPVGGWIQVNQALVEMTGFSAAEFEGMKMADVLHPDEAQEELAKMGQLLAGEIGTFALEQRFRKKDDGYLWVLMNVSQVRDQNHQLLYFVCQILDITERKQALEETRRARRFSENIIESSIDGILAFDPEGEVTVWNSGMEGITGIETDKALGRSVGEVLPFLAQGVDGETVFEKLLAGSAVRLAEISFTIPSSGRSGYCTAHIAPLQDENGGVSGGVAVIRDVTAEREARDRLQASTSLLEERNKELQDFAYVASHDLQEPLRKILAFGDRLTKKCEGLLDEQGQDYMARMQNAARRMQILISDLLAFSRIATEGHPFVPVDLNVIAREVLSDLETRIDETGAEVVVEPLPTIEADATQMRQLIQNLVGNGLKYRRPDVSCRLRIYVTEHSPDDGFFPLRGKGCRLHVADNGIGFDEKYLDRIFTVFQRLHGRNEYPGTGVGLAICRRIVQRHHGWITARSVPGEGTTFITALPYKQPQAPE